MNLSPVQLELAQYPIVSIRSNPNVHEEKQEADLPLHLTAQVMYDSDGRHFAILSVEQSDDSFPYSIEVDVFSPFTMDLEGCRAAYRTSFNPVVIAVNVSRILLSGAREMIHLVTSRSPYGAAKIPTLLLDPSDVKIAFEEDKMDEILIQSFGLDKSEIAAARAAADKESDARSGKKQATKKSSGVMATGKK